ncbi:hypothetical protein ACFOKJ_07250 [Vogesella amnigena]|uniref:Uncharacterized protein n=1 Tax=Vogesella amnigena TaxID=1507449 RepID=A0ABV7TT82_9NEIS
MQISSQSSAAATAISGKPQAKTTGNGQPFAVATPTTTPPASSGLLREQDTALLLPTWQNVGRLAANAQALLQHKLAAAGISASPPFELVESDPNTGYISVRGQRPDAAAIEQLINSDDKLTLAIHNVNALASLVPAMDAAGPYVAAWQAARTDSERMAVFEYYRALMASLRSDTCMQFGPQGLAFSLNGEAIVVQA